MPVQFVRSIFRATSEIMQITNLRSEMLKFDQIVAECRFTNP